MKALNQISLFALTMAFASFSSFAKTNDPGSTESNMVYSSVSEIFAESALLSLSNDDPNQALNWIDKSIAAEETVHNLELKGDLLKAIDFKEAATEYYYKAILNAKSKDQSADISQLQTKIWSVR